MTRPPRFKFVDAPFLIGLFLMVIVLVMMPWQPKWVLVLDGLGIGAWVTYQKVILDVKRWRRSYLPPGVGVRVDIQRSEDLNTFTANITAQGPLSVEEVRRVGVVLHEIANQFPEGIPTGGDGQVGVSGPT